MKQILLFITVLLLFKSSYCCTCIGECTFEKEYKRSSVILTGKIFLKKTIIAKDSLMPLIKIQRAEYTIRVTKLYKGKIETNLLKIITGMGGGDCGFEFRKGSEYIIYCSYENKYYEQGEIVNRFLNTDICRRTRLIADKNELKLLNKQLKRIRNRRRSL
jgi:hypothetical protein